MRYAIGIALLLCLGPLAVAETIRVSSAVSLREPLEELVSIYQAHSGETVELSFGASGALVSQARYGGGVDLLISAAQWPLGQLRQDGLVVGEERVIAENRLVLVARPGGVGPASLDWLRSDTVCRVALGQPKTVPAGAYAMQALAAGRMDVALKDKLVYAVHVAAVLEYVARGEVDAGFVYATDARAAGDRVRVVATVDESWHDRIEYAAAVIKGGHERSAQEFLRFLESPQARQVLARRGFIVPATPPSDKAAVLP